LYPVTDNAGVPPVPPSPRESLFRREDKEEEEKNNFLSPTRLNHVFERAVANFGERIAVQDGTHMYSYFELHQAAGSRKRKKERTGEKKREKKGDREEECVWVLCAVCCVMCVMLCVCIVCCELCVICVCVVCMLVLCCVFVRELHLQNLERLAVALSHVPKGAIVGMLLNRGAHVYAAMIGILKHECTLCVIFYEVTTYFLFLFNALLPAPHTCGW